MPPSEPTFEQGPAHKGKCPEGAAKRQDILKAKLEAKAALEKQRSADLKRKRDQALEFLAILQEDLLAGGEQRLLDAIDVLFQIVDWERQYMPVPEEFGKRLKVHLATCFPIYQSALRMAVEQKERQKALEAQQHG